MTLIFYDAIALSPAGPADVTGALAATTAAATADFDGTVQNPIVGALAATTAAATADFDAIEEMQGALQPSTAGAQANLDGIVANPVTGALASTTAAAQADLDAVEGIPGSLAATTAAAAADLDGSVSGGPITGALNATTAAATAQFAGIAGEDAPPPRGGAWNPRWRDEIRKAQEKPKPKPKKLEKPRIRVVSATGLSVLRRAVGHAEATVTHVKDAEGASVARRGSGVASSVRARAPWLETADLRRSAAMGTHEVLSPKRERDELAEMCGLSQFDDGGIFS